MSFRAIRSKRSAMWVTVGLAAAYALITAHEVYPTPDITPDIRSKIEWILFGEALFAGPIIISGVLSILMARIEARITLLGFAIGYWILTALVFYWTFGFEHDAQYQLMLFLIPIVGFPIIAVLVLALVFGLALENR